MWGPTSLSLRDSLTYDASEENHPFAAATLGIIDPARMLHSLDSFPRQRGLDPLDGLAAAAASDSDSRAYDPAFILPLVDHLLRTKGHIDLHDLIERDVLSFVIAAMSSVREEVRLAASRVLARFVLRADEMRYKGSHQVQVFLSAFRGAIPSTTATIAPCVLAFVGRGVRLMLHPENKPMHPIVSKVWCFACSQLAGFPL